MKILVLFLPLFILGSCTSPVSTNMQTSRHVKIVLDTEEPLSDQDTIFLTGNQKDLGSWESKGLAMTRRAETRWEKTFSVADSTPVEFKFTLGSMDREAVSNRGVIPGNSLLHVVRDTEVYFVIEDFKKNMTPVDSITGK